MSNIIEIKDAIAKGQTETNNSTTITDAQVKQVYDTLRDEKSEQLLVAASKETDESNYTELAVQDIPDPEPTKIDYKDAFSEYGLDEESAEQLIKVIIKYRKDKSIKIYNELPESVKKLADNIRFNVNTDNAFNGKHNGITKDAAAKFLLDSFINDAEINAAINQYNVEVNKAFSEFDIEISKAIGDIQEQIFSNIDKIREEDPEKAAMLEEIKESFDTATTFTKQYNYIGAPGALSAGKINKIATKRFDDECYYFNTKVNVTDVKVPNIAELVDVIKLWLPQYDELYIKKFIVILSRSVIDLDMHQVKNMAYVYKMVDGIYRYKFISTAVKDEKAETMFGAIARVIDKIIDSL